MDKVHSNIHWNMFWVNDFRFKQSFTWNRGVFAIHFYTPCWLDGEILWQVIHVFMILLFWKSFTITPCYYKRGISFYWYSRERHTCSFFFSTNFLFLQITICIYRAIYVRNPIWMLLIQDLSNLIWWLKMRMYNNIEISSFFF